MIAELTSLMNAFGAALDLTTTQQLLNLWLFRAVLLLLLFLVVRAAHGVIRKSVHYFGRAKLFDEHAERITRAVLCYLVDFVAFLLILSLLELKGALTTLLAGAGIMSLAVSLASKDVVANIISGFFIQFDRQFVVGDDVQVLSFRGTVKKLSFRSTLLQTKENSFVTIPNQLFSQNPVVNFTRSGKVGLKK